MNWDLSKKKKKIKKDRKKQYKILTKYKEKIKEVWYI